MSDNKSMEDKPSLNLIDRVEIKYGPKDWEEFDKLEEERREVLSSDDEDSFATKKKKKKPSKKDKKMTEIPLFEEALKKLRDTNWEYCNPLEKHKINLEKMAFKKVSFYLTQMLLNAFEHEMNLELVLKKLGLKTAKILFKTGAHINIGFALKYINSDGNIPKWLLQRHRDMMKSKSDSFNCTQNGLLRKMSGNNNSCLENDDIHI